MRISFSGCANVGKSTLLSYFLRRWPMYVTPSKTYRDVLAENNLEHSSKTTESTQLLILDWMMQEQKNHPKGSKVIYDRCPWDNLAYTLQGNAANLISDEVAAATISFVKESMKDIDIIFWLPYNDQIKIVNDGFRDSDVAFIKATDKIFQELFDQYSDDLEGDVFYPKEDCPAIIRVDGLTIDDRLMFIGEFLDAQGELIETETSILDPSNLDLLEQMIKDQQTQMVQDNQYTNILKQIGKITLDGN